MVARIAISFERVCVLGRFTLDQPAQNRQSQAAQQQSVIDIGTEHLVWQGRPAPRCFTFRDWGRSLFWLAVFAFAGVWQWAGWVIYADSGQALWAMIPLVLLPLVLLLLAFCLSVGRIARARLEWEHVFYVLSAENLRIQCGIPRRIICFDLAELSYVRLDPYGKNSEKGAGENGNEKSNGAQGGCGRSGLGKIYLEFGSRKVALSCVEHAEDLFELLRRHIDAGADAEAD